MEQRIKQKITEMYEAGKQASIDYDEIKGKEDLRWMKHKLEP